MFRVVRHRADLHSSLSFRVTQGFVLITPCAVLNPTGFPFSQLNLGTFRTRGLCPPVPAYLQCVTVRVGAMNRLDLAC